MKLLQRIVERLFKDRIENIVDELTASRAEEELKYSKLLVSQETFKQIIECFPNANETYPNPKECFKNFGIRWNCKYSDNNRTTIQLLGYTYDDRLSWRENHEVYSNGWQKNKNSIERYGKISKKQNRILGMKLSVQYYYNGIDLPKQIIFVPLRKISFITQSNTDEIEVNTFYWDFTSVFIPVTDDEFDYYLNCETKFTTGEFYKFNKHVANDEIIKTISVNNPELMNAIVDNLGVKNVSEIIVLGTHPDFQKRDSHQFTVTANTKWEKFFPLGQEIKVESIRLLSKEENVSDGIRVTVDEIMFVGACYLHDKYLFMKKSDYPYSQNIY